MKRTITKDGPLVVSVYLNAGFVAELKIYRGTNIIRTLLLFPGLNAESFNNVITGDVIEVLPAGYQGTKYFWAKFNPLIKVTGLQAEEKGVDIEFSSKEVDLFRSYVLEINMILKNKFDGYIHIECISGGQVNKIAHKLVRNYRGFETYSLVTSILPQGSSLRIRRSSNVHVEWGRSKI